MKNTYLHFGAGGIGRALAGPLFARAGYDVVFVDANPALVASLRACHEYTLRTKDDLPPGVPDAEVFRNIQILHLDETDAIADAVSRASLMGTAVGAAHIPAVLKTMVPGLLKRETPVSILFCENLHNITDLARETLRPLLPPCFPLDERVGLVPTCIGKMVPRPPAEALAADPLEVWGEAYHKIIADSNAFRGEIPRVKGLVLPQTFAAYTDRKLYLHNLGHATCAVHGFLRGHAHISDAIADPEVERETRAVMNAAASALAARWPGALDTARLSQHVDDLLRRFHNPWLRDTVFRVGRDLPRKLSPDDRFIGALRMVVETGNDPAPLCRAIAAALRFRALDENGKPDPADAAFLEQVKTRGADDVLRAHCRIQDPVLRAGVVNAMNGA